MVISSAEERARRGRRGERGRVRCRAETARTRKPAALASSAVAGPIQTAGSERTSIDSACASDTQAANGRAARERRPRRWAHRPPPLRSSARDSRAPRASGTRSRSSTSAPRARSVVGSSSSARSPRTTRTRSPVAIGRSAAMATPWSGAAGTPTSIPSCSRARRVAGPIAAQDGAPSSVGIRSTASRIARAPFGLVIDDPSVRVEAVAAAAARSPPGGANSIAIAGTRTGSKPASRRAGTSSPACSAARVTRTRRALERRPSRRRRSDAVRTRAPESSSVASSRRVLRRPPTGPRRRAIARRTHRGWRSRQEVELVADDRGQGADRRSAAASGCAEECALGLDRHSRRRSSMAAASASIRSSSRRTWIGDRPLSGGRRHDLGVEPLGDPVGEPQPVEPRAREHEGVRLARIEPAQPRVDVAVQRMDDEIRPPGEQEARRRGLSVPTREPDGRSSSPRSIASVRTTSASRGSARGR